MDFESTIAIGTGSWFIDMNGVHMFPEIYRAHGNFGALGTGRMFFDMKIFDVHSE